ncbi:BadF/BadG/BcrA/BcrD ATPase family protein [Arthrobacter oryzae]|uniref:N-acetylglucosamine kinase n=1 Tax=Arthrobacter oryzae TaxID=409290 RepID=UPI002863868C|nr:BadF/BadG/BcrA/BcrD ATPase family protein [Arthrobacter oryzae]MDR6508498.1 N-acetylglucosamine kinase-like BadF-type ATPase [Arthrobacter oryzae]
MSPASSQGHLRGPRSLIGLDIGGSKTHGIRIIDGRIVDDRTTGSANVQNVSTQTAAVNLANLLNALGANDTDHVYVGAGGVDTAEDMDELRRLIAPHAPKSTVTIVHDTRLILAAAGVRTGIAVIAGTGSAVWGVTADGAEERAGGWGYLLGDEGSGYWLGRVAVRQSLHRANLGLPADDLTTALLDACGLRYPEELIRLFHNGTDRTYWADKSRLVFECADRGHAASRDIIQQAGKSLAEQTLQVAKRLMIQGPVVLGGGLGRNQPALQEAFTTHLAGQGITDVRMLSAEPVYGVRYLAEGATVPAP